METGTAGSTLVALALYKLSLKKLPSPELSQILGQCEESGRDQGHATLCVSLMGTFCQMAYI